MGRGTHEPCVQSHAISIWKTSKDFNEWMGTVFKAQESETEFRWLPQCSCSMLFNRVFFFIMFFIFFIMLFLLLVFSIFLFVMLLNSLNIIESF